MGNIIPIKPQEVIQEIIHRNDFFPGNSIYPLLIYKKVFDFIDQSTEAVQKFLKKNGWINSWVDSIYPYHHYHSNTHEALVVFRGSASVQIGGENGAIYVIAQNDVIIFPAGVSHKNLESSEDFTTIGAYPFDVHYDMYYGNADEYLEAEKNVKRVGLPLTDPVFGKNGLLFDFWK